MEELFSEIQTITKNTEKKRFIQSCEIYGSPQDKLFVIYYKNFIPKSIADKYFNIFERDIVYNSAESSKIKIFGEEHEIPRKQVAYGDPGTFYNFSGIRVDAISWNQNNELCKVLYKLRCMVNKQFGCNFNFVLINRYADGDDYIGFHADDEKDLSEDSPIVGLTFGSERDFQFKNIKTGKNFSFSTGRNKSLVLHHGSCVSMQYPTNKYWKHGLPKRAGSKSPRINLTFRVMNVNI
jgi:alkylated DNA repair dioxygenase AlkB